MVVVQPTNRSSVRFFLSLVVSIGVLICVATTAARSSDHYDAPVGASSALDLASLYAFQPPTASNSVLILTVSPNAGIAGATTFLTGADQVTYAFEVDNSGDAVADVTYSVVFAASSNGSQPFTLRRNGVLAASGSTGTAAAVAGGGQVQAGQFDDPFFFDFEGLENAFSFTGVDFYAGTDILAIVLEIPASEVGNNVGVWATTVQSGLQVDRVGRPTMTLLLVPPESVDAFNSDEPADDLANYESDVNASIAALSNQSQADALTPILLPDVLTFDTSNAAGFLNGRRLEDDVMDAMLDLLTAGGVSADGVGANDRTFSVSFPYLAPANSPIFVDGFESGNANAWSSSSR